MDTNRKMTETLTKDGNKALEQTHHLTENALEKSRDAWQEWRSKGRDAYVKAQKRAQETWRSTQDLTHKHPGKALGVAFVLGAVIGGALMALRKKD